MHVLILGKVWPEPASSAAGSRMLQLIGAFRSAGWRITFASAAGTSEHSADLHRLGVSSCSIELNHGSFDEFIRQLQPSLVLFDRFSTEEQFGWRVAEHCPAALRVLDMEDLHCLRAARQAALKENREFHPGDLVNDIAKRELASIFRCDLSLVISGYEMELLHRFFKVDTALLHYIPFLADPLTEADTAAWPSFAGRHNFISIGNFLHAPNWDATLFLKEEIWPLIRQHLPEAGLEVYGAYPSHKVFQLHQPREGFLVKGRADSVEQVMSAARVCLAPLRFGAGLKGKLLDAMRYGTPSVTTPTGAEGMQEGMAWNGAIATTTGEFATAAVDLYRHEETWQAAQAQGIRLYNSLFNRKKHEEALLAAITDLNGRLPGHRLHNFTGALLWHHSALSTKYMALWIEAKNKLKE